jgi:putative transposase
VLIKNGIAISMDDRGSWRDNVFCRTGLTVEYEEVYHRADATVYEARASIKRRLDSTTVEDHIRRRE